MKQHAEPLTCRLFAKQKKEMVTLHETVLGKDRKCCRSGYVQRYHNSRNSLHLGKTIVYKNQQKRSICWGQCKNRRMTLFAKYFQSKKD